MRYRIQLFLGLSALLGITASLFGGARVFVNWETPHVHPLDLTSDQTLLLAVNTADARLELFDAKRSACLHLGSVPVGLDPVSVRARTNREAWVVNRVSDSVSVVDLATMTVLATLPTSDEPADVVFAGEPVRAFVSCSQTNRVEVFDVTAPYTRLASIVIDGERPRAMAVSSDGREVYVAIFESGNRTTVLQESTEFTGVPSDSRGPYGGQNPPPNSGSEFDPPIRSELLPATAVALIVKENDEGRWLDDNQGDWTEFVSGPFSALSGRVRGWDLPDHDVAVIDTASGNVRYATGLMNLVMAIAVSPKTGRLTVVGTDATNQIRYEPVVKGRFLRVEMGSFSLSSLEDKQVIDLNPHLDYKTSTISQSERDKSLGDPRAIVWNGAGDRGYVAGMGSNNVVVIDGAGACAGLTPTIDVGEGPTGLALNESRNRLYVLNRFEASISVVDTTTETVIAGASFYDPTPPAIKVGRKHLYNTHKTSGLGQIACASCHVDGRMDRLGWDLGNPTGAIKPFDQFCESFRPHVGSSECEDWHPMKGPLVTQTLQDIIGKEPLHWRGDRDGLEEFNPAFMGLQGDDEMLTDHEMQEFKDFLSTLTFPPNPFRNFDNTLPTDVPLPGQFSVGRFSTKGTPLPNGNAVRGLDAFRTARLDEGIDSCVTCHTLPCGVGTNYVRSPVLYEPIPPGPNGELFHVVRSVPGISTNTTRKIAQLRNLYEKVGFDGTQSTNRAGFGFFYDGSTDSLTRFLSLPTFRFQDDQQIADVIAFLLSFSGSDLPEGSASDPNELPGPSSQDTPAAVGRQWTLDASNINDPVDAALIGDIVALADVEKVGIIVKGLSGNQPRGYVYVGNGIFQSDRQSEQSTLNQLHDLAAAGAALTVSVVPFGTQRRLGIDRDEDSYLDRDELDDCSNPADPASIPGVASITGDFDASGRLDAIDAAWFTGCMTGPGQMADDRCRCAFDLHTDVALDLADYSNFQNLFAP